MNWRRALSTMLHRPEPNGERERKAKLIARVKRVSDAAIAETYRSLRERVRDGYDPRRVQ